MKIKILILDVRSEITFKEIIPEGFLSQLIDHTCITQAKVDGKISLMINLAKNVHPQINWVKQVYFRRRCQQHRGCVVVSRACVGTVFKHG